MVIFPRLNLAKIRDTVPLKESISHKSWVQTVCYSWTVWTKLILHFREEVIMTKWDKLIGMLEARRTTLVGFRDLVGLFREMDGAHGDMQDIEVLSVYVSFQFAKWWALFHSRQVA